MLAMVLGFAVLSAGEYDRILKIRRAASLPGIPYLSRDGEHFMRLKGNALLRYDFTTGNEVDTLYTFPFKIDEFILSPDEKTVLFSRSSSVRKIYRRSKTADFYVMKRGGEAKLLFKGARDLAFLPDGKAVCFSRENNLYLYSFANGSEVAVTSDGKWNHIINGTSDWVYEEEYRFTKAYAVSGDSRKIAYLKFDESEVKEFSIMRYDGELYNKPFSFKYPKVGEKNSVVKIFLYDIKSGKTEQIASGEEDDQYLFNLSWTPSGKLFFYRVNRLQNHFEVVMYENGKTRVIYDESSPKFVERPTAQTISFLDDDLFVVNEETTSGFFSLFLHSVSKGRIRTLVDWKRDVVSLLYASKKEIFFTATGENPSTRTLYRTSIMEESNIQRLSPENGVCSAIISPSAKYVYMTYSQANEAPRVVVCSSSGKELYTIRDTRAQVRKLYSDKKVFSSFCTERKDTLHYWIQYPNNMAEGRKYPLLIVQYSGPGSQQVSDSFGVDWYTALLEKGYIVACADGRGTGYRGEAFKKQVYRSLGKKETEDQISFARFLSQMPCVDKDRIGIYGWSYGGFMALNCAFSSDLYKMAIAVAPVTSWRFYDSIYTEIYNGLPQDNAEGYDENSPLNKVESLLSTTRLLIIHGTADDNVHFQNSMELARRLNLLHKQYDMMVYPDQNHSMLPTCTSDVREKMIIYTLEHL